MNASLFGFFRHITHSAPRVSQSDAHDVDIRIPETRAREALTSLQAAFPNLPRYHSRNPGFALRDLQDALTRLGEHVYRAYGDREIRVVDLSGSRDHDHAVFHALGSLIPSDCSVVFSTGTHHEVWQFSQRGMNVTAVDPVTRLTGSSTPQHTHSSAGRGTAEQFLS